MIQKLKRLGRLAAANIKTKAGFWHELTNANITSESEPQSGHTDQKPNV